MGLPSAVKFTLYVKGLSLRILVGEILLMLASRIQVRGK